MQTLVGMAEGDVLDFNAMTSYGEGDGCGAGFNSAKVYSGQGFIVSVRLTDIRGSRFEECENPDTGEPERGLFIPLRHSGLFVTPKRAVIANYDMGLAQVASAKYTHLLRQIVDADVDEWWRKMGYWHDFDGYAYPKGYRKDKGGKR